jgi:group I intron endonuclease
MGHIVYKITNSVNGCIYIGSTSKELDIRFKQHCKSKMYQYPLYNDMLMHGPDLFSAEVLENCDSKNGSLSRETYWINYYKKISPELLYNIKKPIEPFIPTEQQLKMRKDLQALLRRNQKWLAGKIGMRTPVLCDKINGFNDWTQKELDLINEVMNTDFKL